MVLFSVVTAWGYRGKLLSENIFFRQDNKNFFLNTWVKSMLYIISDLNMARVVPKPFDFSFTFTKHWKKGSNVNVNKQYSVN